MRALATALVIMALAISVSPFTPQQDAPPGQTATRPRIVVELSDLITHTPFQPCGTSSGQAASAPKRLRIATWNIRAAQSAPVDVLAAEMRAMQADLFALQEVDIRTRRGSYVDQPEELAKALGFHYVFAASIKWDEGYYGLAVLSRYPLTKAARHRVDSAPEAEPRIVLDVTVCVDGRPLHVLNHHADRRTASRALGFVDVKRLMQEDLGRGILLLGDLNEYSDAPGVRSLIDAGLIDLSAAGAADPANTVRTRRVDYLLADGPLAQRASGAVVWPTDKSDHHALLADLEW